MGHFRATIRGNRGEASRLGTKNSGIHATINGWDIGVTVNIFHVDGKDVITVYKTSGSNGYGSDECIARLTEGEENV